MLRLNKARKLGRGLMVGVGVQPPTNNISDLSEKSTALIYLVGLNLKILMVAPEFLAPLTKKVMN